MFFHQRANGRRKRNLIAYLKTTTNDMVWGHDEKEEILFQFYSNLLGTRIECTQRLDWYRLQLSLVEDEEAMNRPFSEAEIEHTIKLMPAEKVPGPDGFTGSFYKRCWSIIKGDILAAMNCVYELRVGPMEHMNGANIVLIPKTGVAECAKDFRPICLIHSFAKLITKTLAIRLSRNIDKLISSSQSAFIKGRCINDNFMYVRNLARAYHRTKTPALLFRLDISKAFDSVSWEYILEMLEHRGFSARWREWITIMLRTSHSTVLLNGCPGNTIAHARGLRQGGPLSPISSSLPLTPYRRCLSLQHRMVSYHR